MAGIKRTIAWLKSRRPYGFWPGFIAGVLYFSWIFFWLWDIYPLNSFGLSDGPASFIIILFLFTVSVSGMAVFWGFFSHFLFAYHREETQIIPFSLYLASVFVLAEYIRSFFFGILWLGNGTYFGPHWTLGNIAYLFSSITPIVKTSSIWGIYGIEFLLIYLITGLFFSSLKKNYKEVSLYLLIPVVVFFIGNSDFKSTPDQEEKKIPISIIQTRIPSKISYTQEESLADFKTKLELIKEAAEFLDFSQERGLIIFPEGSNFLNKLSYLLDENDIKNYFTKLSKNESLVIDQFPISEGQGLKSKIALISSQNGLIGTYDKRLLTPAGEFVPFILKLPLFLASRLYVFDPPVDFYSGSKPSIFEFDGNIIKIVVCSELLSPSIVKEGNADFIVAIHNFGLFNGGRGLEKQIRAMSQFRAAENKKYSITSSNYGQSYIINSAGKVEKMAANIDSELLTGSIIPNKSRTWYNYIGDWPILLLSSAFFAIGLRRSKFM